MSMYKNEAILIGIIFGYFNSFKNAKAFCEANKLYVEFDVVGRESRLLMRTKPSERFTVPEVWAHNCLIKFAKGQCPTHLNDQKWKTIDQHPKEAFAKWLNFPEKVVSNMKRRMPNV